MRHPQQLRAQAFQLRIFACALALLPLSASIAAPSLAAQLPASERIPAVGDSPVDAGPLATGLSPAFKKKSIAQALKKVADWQLQRVQANYEQDWTMAALYTGFMAVPAAVSGTTYQDAMQSMGNQFHWELGKRPDRSEEHTSELQSPA